MKKQILILALVILALFSVSCACASDVNDTQVSGSDAASIGLFQGNGICADDESQTDGVEMLLAGNYDETVDAQNDSIVSTGDDAKYSELSAEIGSGGDKNLTHKYYSYDVGSTIAITEAGVIDGRGAVIDMAGSDIQAFSVSVSGVTFKNLTIKNAQYDGNGSAIYFYEMGTVEDCSFVNNSATCGGAICFRYAGFVINCNFTDNMASKGSAICFLNDTSNEYISTSSFLNNRADVDYDTPLQVTINGNDIEIAFIGQNNLINAIYSDEMVNFNKVTYWGAKGITNTEDKYPSKSNREAGQNISLRGFLNGNILNTVKTTDANGKIVLDNVSGDYWIVVRHDSDSYYTEAETILANMKFHVNVTETKTTNRTVNITAKSNIYNETMPGSLMFILSDGTRINATYASDGIWWAEHTFDDYKDYEINATYSGLDGVIIKNATISIMKAVPIDVNDVSILYYEIANVVVAVPDTINGQKISISVNKTSKNVTVENGVAKADFSGLHVGEYVIAVEYLGDGYHSANSTSAKLTVNKANSTLSIGDVALNYGDSINVTATTTGAIGVTAKIDGQDAVVNNYTIVISSLDGGIHALTVTTVTDENHTSVSKTVNITVWKLDSKISAFDKAYVINYGDGYSVTVKDEKGNLLDGKKVTFRLDGKNIGSATTNGEGVATIKLTEKILKAAKAGKRNLVVEFAGDTNYKAFSKTVRITINKEKTKIKAKKKTFKGTKKVKKYKITLKDSKGNAIKKVKVTLKIKGKTYKTKTNTKGKATFKIKNLKKKGKYKAIIKFGGNDYYKKATKKMKIKIR